jgi:small conductance mechanosensitive channel
MEDILNQVYEYLAKYGLQVIAAVAIFLIGRVVAKLLVKLLAKGMVKAKIDRTLATFIEDLAYAVLLIFIIIAALAKIGVETTSFIAVVGAAGLAVGLALQGSLANFASGVLMLVFKPFKVDDLVEIAGATGVVKEIQIFNTIINSPDNLRIIVPNAQVTGGNIINYTVNGKRRVDLVVGVSYEDDLKKTKKVIDQVLEVHEKVLNDPAPTVAVSELGDSSVNFVVRPWCNSADYWDVYFDVTTKVKIALDENGITIPFPQRDVHMISSS